MQVLTWFKPAKESVAQASDLNAMKDSWHDNTEMNSDLRNILGFVADKLQLDIRTAFTLLNSFFATN